MRFAMCFGLTRVDPVAYDGWSGDCPGCDVDMLQFSRLCHYAQFDGVYGGVNAAVTTELVHPIFASVCADLAAGDLLVLYNSGHGGQQVDVSGDEVDGKDETLVWWDGELNDDIIGAYLQTIPEDVNVLFVTDTCHSGTNFRGKPQRKTKRRQKSAPVRLERASEEIVCNVLHFGGCDDSRFSYGNAQGGVFTAALIDAANRARKDLTYAEWFKRAARRMPSTQVPTISFWGSHDFRERIMLT